MLKMLNNPAMPPPVGYSHAASATGIGSLLFISGQVGVAADGSVPDSVAEQTKLVFANIKTMLGEAGMDATNIAKLTIYLTDPNDMGGFMQGAAGAMPGEPPAATLLIVKGLAAPNLKIEIEAIATR